jgi:hypothetical protein
MAKREWTFDVDGTRHIVQLEHKYFSGRRTILVDGTPVDAPRQLVDAGGEYPFTINGHEGFVQIKTNGVTFKYDCVFDAKSVSTGKEVLKPQSLPMWSWIFMILCCIIPVITLGGALPVLIGFGGAFACAKIGKSHIKKISAKVLLSFTVLLISWGLFAALLFFASILKR